MLLYVFKTLWDRFVVFFTGGLSLVGPAVLCPEASPQGGKGREPVHSSAFPMSFSEKPDFLLCGTNGGCPFGPHAGLDNDEPGEQCGRVLAGMEEQSVQWGGCSGSIGSGPQ